MLQFLADENFDNNIVRALFRRKKDFALVRVQDVGLSGTSDPEILEWTANNNRILLTHDVATITKYAYERVEKGLSMPGVFEVERFASTTKLVEDILLLADYSLDGEWEGQIRYLPLK